MSAPRILFAPTHRTGLAPAVGAAIAEIAAREQRAVRYHHVGALSPALAWDRWEASSFLDLSLYDAPTMVRLYDSSTRGADISLLAAGRGLFDTTHTPVPRGRQWAPADVARALDAPVVLVVDAREWEEGLAILIQAFNERESDLNLVAVILTGVADRAHRERLRKALDPVGAPVAGVLYRGGTLGWDSPPPGPGRLPLDDAVLEEVFAHVDVAGLEALAGQRGFLAGARDRPVQSPEGGPVVLVAGGRGFTMWSRDSLDVLRRAGAVVRRLDLVEDRSLPDDAAGLVLAGHLWPETVGELAQNFTLMRDVRLRVGEGMPTLALGGGMLYLLRRLQDPGGRSHELAGFLPAEGELVDELEEPAYYRVRSRRPSVLLDEGDEVTGWMTADADIMEAPVARNFAFTVSEGSGEERMEGAAAARLLCSRILVHPAAAPGSAERFVDACRDYSSPAGASAST